MNHLTNKKILISAELKKAPVGSFFREMGLELCTEFDKDLLADYLFIVDDYLEELKILPRIQTKKTIASTCSSAVRGFFDENLINEKSAKSLLTSYFKNAQEFDLVDSYSTDFKNIFTLKIHDYLNIGYFVDTIVVEAYKNKFDYDQIRNYLNFALNYSLKLIEKQDRILPLEVCFSYSDTGFAVQISMSAPELDLRKDFNGNAEKLTKFSSETNFFDASYFKKRERLLLSSFWFKEKSLKSFKSYFFTEIVERHNNAEENSALINRLDEAPENVQYEANSIKIDQSKKLHLARKFCLFIKNVRRREEFPPEVDSLNVDDIDNYLTHYPRKESLLELDLEVKNFIIKLLNDDNLFAGVAEFIQKIASSNLDNHVDEIQRILGQKSLEDISEILKIKADPKDESNDLIKVKGWADAKNEEEWKVKRSGLIEQVKEEITTIKGSGRNVVEDDFIKIMSDKLNAESEDVRTVVKGLVEEALSSELIKSEKLDEAQIISVLSQQPAMDAMREKLTGQVVRMKKLMEQMRSEIVKLREEAKASVKEDYNPTASESQVYEIFELKKTLVRTLESMKAREKISLKQKSDYELILEAKENKNQVLEARLEQVKDEFSRSREFANEEKLEILQVENKSLAARLEHANQKINIVSGNIEKQDNDSLLKKEKELSALKTNLQTAQALIEKFKQERIGLDNKLIEEKEKYIKLRDEKVVVAGPAKELAEKDLTLANLQAEKRTIEEKHRHQAIELKKMEQKLKFTSAQFDELQKRKALPAAANNKSSEVHIKQLEHTKGQLAETNSDLVEKKKELIKLKQENSLLSSKMAELEKKLSNMDKKAA